MTRQNISVVSLLCAFVFFSASVSAFFFTPDRVHLLDTKAIGSSGCSAYLFRGPVPLDKDLTFVHSDLVKAMADGASAVNIDFPQKNLKIIDFSLLDPTSATELTWIESERAFFSNGTMGSLFETPMHGSSVNPYFLPSKAQNELGIDYKDWSKDHLPALIDALNYLLTGDSSSLLNHASSYETFSIFGYSAEALAASRALASDGTCSDIAIYFHCHYGQDRTGEVAGSYLLTYGGFLQSYATPVPSPNTFTRGIPTTLQQLVKMNEQVAGGHIVKNNQRALSWTCFSLVALGDVAHKNLDCSLNYEIDPPLNGPAPVAPAPKNSNSNASANNSNNNNNNNSNDSSASALGVSSSVALFVLFALFSVVF